MYLIIFFINLITLINILFFIRFNLILIMIMMRTRLWS
jgi:hypothetical protein